ncbi:NAD(P)-dependent oxidoreductase [Halorubrum sp. AJ67]|uniref:NAD-dependent epimerase/dehydratase family protein n=1 Tax=Halorubrum sp. AJ67 TaxID=1173487 RepID=UPI0003DBA7E0|nr:NAD(P)-dependent oxidoreductase [Halorubrum sp. AJ67]CDK39038.1 NAD-dependent epimerase/dehydratase [Halorubrum sp. AJ67]
MNVLVTGSYGRCGTAIIDHLDDNPDYEFTYLNRSDRPSDHRYGGFDTHVADITDYDAIRPAFEDQDAVVHLAAYPYTDGAWEDVFEPNIIGMYNAIEAARDAGVDAFVFASTNHVMGMYEEEHAPELYEPDYDLRLDPTDRVRPDSCYGATKSFGEDLGRYYTERYEYPRRFYALRICSVLPHGIDHPYGRAERRVENGEIERGSDAYDRSVARTKATWHSRRDFAHLVERCLADGSVTFDVFNAVSDNDRRWFSIRNARGRLGYDPDDNGEAWDGPPIEHEHEGST